MIFFLIVSCDLCAQIIVDVDGYSDEQLVKDVLMTGDECSVFSNIKSNRKSGVAYFNKNGTDFPFSEGLLLSTGYADTAPGPTRYVSSAQFIGGETNRDSGEIGTGSDPDLDNAIPLENIEINIGNETFEILETRYDATYIEFDYIPFSDSISFDFILASSKYTGNLPCFASDIFAFLITDSSGNTRNLAVLPETETPIKISNIHPFIPDALDLSPPAYGCSAINQAYYNGYNEIGDLAVKYIGQTKVFNMGTDVIPGNQYHIKLVIADGNFNALDSAVFLLKGDYNIDSLLGEDLAIYNSNTVCVETSILSTNLSLSAEYEWFKLNENTDEFEVILNETDAELEVIESGTYKIFYDGPGSCDFEDHILVEFIHPPVAFPIDDIEQCSTLRNGRSVFDLTYAKEQILGTQDDTNLNITFHRSQSDADNNINPIEVTAHETLNSIVVGRIANLNCYDTTTFNLKTIPSNTSPSFEINGFENSIVSVCVDEFGNLEMPYVLGNPLNEDYVIRWESNYDTDVNGFEGEEYVVTNLNEETKYTLTLSSKIDINNCALYTFETLIKPVYPIDSIEITVEEPIFSSTYTLTVNTSGDNIENHQFQLDEGILQPSNIFYNVSPGEHTITATLIENCNHSLSKKIQLISYPKFFTPNGDGNNDFWNISGLNQAPYIIVIFNRYGKLIKTINTQSVGWDGTFSGNLLPQDDYWFSIKYIDPTSTKEEMKKFTGHFTLKR